MIHHIFSPIESEWPWWANLLGNLLLIPMTMFLALLLYAVMNLRALIRSPREWWRDACSRYDGPPDEDGPF